MCDGGEGDGETNARCAETEEVASTFVPHRGFSSSSGSKREQLELGVISVATAVQMCTERRPRQRDSRTGMIQVAENAHTCARLWLLVLSVSVSFLSLSLLLPEYSVMYSCKCPHPASARTRPRRHAETDRVLHAQIMSIHGDTTGTSRAASRRG